MAAKKSSLSPVYKRPKFPIYEALYKLNQAFQSLALEIEHLDDYEAIPLKTLRFYRALAEELRAMINRSITLVLYTREEQDEWLNQQSRMAAEKKVREVGSKK